MLAFDWDLLGYAFCRLWQNQTFALLSDVQGGDIWVLVFWVAASLALAAGIPLLYLRASLTQGRTWLVVLSGAFAALGVPLILAGSLLESPVPFAAGAAVSGAGTAALWLAWLDRYAALSMGDIVRYTFCSTLLMCMLNVACDALPGRQATTEVLFVLAPFASVVMALREWGTPRPGRPEGADAGEEAFAPRSLGGLCAVMFLFPVVYYASIGALSPGISLLDRSGGDVASLLVFALVMKLAKGRASLATAYRVSMPLVLGGLLLCFAFPSQTGRLVSVLVGGGYKFALMLILTLLLCMAPQGGLRWVVLGTPLLSRFAGNAVARAIELSGVGLVPSSDGFVIVVAAVVALVCVAFWTFPTGGAAVTSRGAVASASQGGVASERALEVVCASLGREHGLTTREQEVLLLLAQGRSRAVIADLLAVSPGTAHTHIIHVYQKTGIHDQQELIGLVRDLSHQGPAPTA